MKSYHLTLQNGDTRDIKILDKPMFSCKLQSEGGNKFKTLQQISEDIDNVQYYDATDPHHLYQDYIGCIRDEGVMFDVYKGLRNPIVKLELIEK